MFIMPIFFSQKALPPTLESSAIEGKRAHILVMGLTGAGKSTFISKATGDDSILVNGNLDSGKSILDRTSRRDREII